MATKKPQVYVFVNTWKDRHGDEGVNVEVFGTKKRANQYLAEDVENYLIEHDAIDDDNNVDTSCLNSFDAGDIHTDECTTVYFLKQVKKSGYAEINVDGDGTYASWSLTKKTVR